MAVSVKSQEQMTEPLLYLLVISQNKWLQLGNSAFDNLLTLGLYVYALLKCTYIKKGPGGYRERKKVQAFTSKLEASARHLDAVNKWPMQAAQ